jgi:hypothetical protein
VFGIWHESTTVFRALLGAFFRGLARALPWTVAGCVLLAAGSGLLVVWLSSLPRALSSTGLTVGSNDVLAFYLVVGLIGGSSFGVHRGIAELLDAAQGQTQRLLGPALDRVLAVLPLDQLEGGDPRRLKAVLERALSAPLGSGSFLQRQLSRLVAVMAADRSNRFLGCLGNEPGLSARERLRNALISYSCTQHRASLAVASWVITVLMVLLCAVPPVALYLLGR